MFWKNEAKISTPSRRAAAIRDRTLFKHALNGPRI